MIKKMAFWGSRELAQVIVDITPFRCLDIGARGGFLKDLDSFAWAVDIYGFEADKTECDRLNNQYKKQASHSFRNVAFYPIALGQRAQKRTLYLTKAAGTSSFLQPMAEVGDKFSRSDLFTVTQTYELDTIPLDDFIATEGLNDIVFIKLDVEGLELEILQSAKNLLQSSLLALKLEVAFFSGHRGHPFYGEIEMYLRNFGFIPMEFLYLNHWRRLTKIKYPKKSSGFIPFSKGQLVHGDVLFFKDPDLLAGNSSHEIESRLKAAVLAIAYGYIDHAYYILKFPSVKQYLENKYHISLEREIGKLSSNLASRYDREKIVSFLFLVKKILRIF